MTPRSLPSSSLRARAFALAVVLWAFGLATTTLLVGVWGRSVVNDSETLSSSALAALDPDTVSDQIAAWVLSEALSVPGVPETTAETIVRGVATSASARLAIESVVTDIVDAAAAPAGSETTIDVAAAIEPLRPVVVTALEEAGVSATPAEVDGFLRQLEGLVLTSAERTASVGAISTARSTLTTVMLVGGAGLLVFGAAALRLSEDRSVMMRSLANRLIVSSLTFALFLRIGAWAVDPGGGRSALRESSAILLASNTRSVLLIAAAGLVVSTVTSIGIRRVRGIRRRLDRKETAWTEELAAPTEPPEPATRPQSVFEPAGTRDRASAR